MTASRNADAMLARNVSDPLRLERVARDVAALTSHDKRCGEYPENWKLRCEAMHTLVCIEPVVDGRHDGHHRSRLGERWAQARRLTAVERVEERRPVSW